MLQCAMMTGSWTASTARSAKAYWRGFARCLVRRQVSALLLQCRGGTTRTGPLRHACGLCNTWPPFHGRLHCCVLQKTPFWTKSRCRIRDGFHFVLHLVTENASARFGKRLSGRFSLTFLRLFVTQYGLATLPPLSELGSAWKTHYVRLRDEPLSWLLVDKGGSSGVGMPSPVGWEMWAVGLDWY
ncbi:hypothetical protein BDP81DRAFT_4073 [Colletotrichum phormii]|uniref:Uncharacterized protein n=1 Tax=Colletotrichum phormii TaxID=359342 RepID=A0AAJ0A3V2_9PEZI|nr:uncharacterized protein BDP81DRAFT_4073 [Colletotrichum phormii]KAK1655448.1 hypothetical protein BDP81DRAFT_4073 [Colletotrichum phormii]